MSNNKNKDSIVTRVLDAMGLAEEEIEDSEVRDDVVINEVVPPTDSSVIERGIDNLIDERQEQKARERLESEDIEAINTDQIEVELEISEPESLIKEASKRLAELREQLLNELDRIVALQENSVSGADIDTMAYVIERDAGYEDSYTIIGGGESIIWNLGNKNDWTDDEIEFVIECHRVAARRNGLARHLLLDTAIIIPHKTND